MTRPRRRAPAAALALAVFLASACTGGGGAPAPDLTRLPGIVVGRSSRADVLRVMGRPGQVLRSAKGEAWTYEAQGEARDGGRLAAGARAATTVAGALIPFAGLVGTGLGLADTMRGQPQRPSVTTVTIEFAEPGVVRDCTYSTNAMTAGDLLGADGRAPLDCRRPLPLADDLVP